MNTPHLFLLGSALLAAALATSARAQCPDSLSIGRTGPAATYAQGRVVIAGGFDAPGQSSTAVDVYDVAGGAWATSALSESRLGSAATAAGGMCFVAGGGRSSFQGVYAWNGVDVYLPALDVWRVTRLSQARFFLAATAVGDLAIFAGGARTSSPPFSPVDTVDVFDTLTRTWSTGRLSEPRQRLAAASAGGVALFAGGLLPWTGGAGIPVEVSDRVDLFDSATGLWSTATLSVPRTDMVATHLGTRVLFAGGYVDGGSQLVPSDVVDIYDTATGTWSVARLSVPRARLAAATVGSRALFAGGHDGNASTDVVDVFDGTRWFVTRLSVPRHDLAGVSAGSEALFAGGTVTVAGADVASDAVDRFPVGFPAPFGFGDGSAGPCPCGNTGSTGRGCANSAGAGAWLELAGCNSVQDDTLIARAEGLPPGVPALLVASSSAVGCVPLGDGLGCTAAPLQRFGVRAAGNDGVAAWGPGLAGAGGWSSGEVRRLQVVYRDPAGPCGAGFNLSSGAEIALVD